ncbi:MAG: hypothetical protein ACRDXC_00135 [Acidimicrobiales bacterium]
MERVSLLVVCTGNSSRSVMAGLMLEHLAGRHGLGLSVKTAGTHALEGLPIGARTLAALRSVPELAREDPCTLSAADPAAHRSHQLRADGVSAANLVVVMESGHVRYVRRHHPAAAARTAQLRWLAANLAPGPERLETRVAALGLECVELDPADDVSDPAGGGDADYAACAADIWMLCRELAARL